MQVLSPLELLKIVEARLPTGEIHLPSTYHALGSSANGGPVGSSDLELKIWSKDAPEPKLISVRAVLGTRHGHLPPSSPPPDRPPDRPPLIAPPDRPRLIAPPDRPP